MARGKQTVGVAHIEDRPLPAAKMRHDFGSPLAMITARDVAGEALNTHQDDREKNKAGALIKRLARDTTAREQRLHTRDRERHQEVVRREGAAQLPHEAHLGGAYVT